MNDTFRISTCGRGDDLVSYLYGEAHEDEARDLEKHLQLCESCRNDLASFNQVRESLLVWKEGALSGSTPPQVKFVPRHKSALAAFREFFDLSPLWLKGAVGFALVLFCVMSVFVFGQIGRKPNSTNAGSVKQYDEEYIKQAVAEALKKQAEGMTASVESNLNQAQDGAKVNMPKKQTIKPGDRSTPVKTTRRPLSRSEREQLATDLRLITTKNEDDLHLLSDRINQEF